MFDTSGVTTDGRSFATVSWRMIGVVAVHSMTHRTNISITAISQILGGDALIDTSAHRTMVGTIDRLSCQPGTGTRTLTARIDSAVNIIIVSISSTFFNTLMGTISLITRRRRGCILVNGDCRRTRGRHRTVRILVHRHYGTLVIRSGTLDSSRLTRFVSGVPNVILVGHIIPKCTRHYIYLSGLDNTQVTAHVLLGGNRRHVNCLSSDRNVRSSTVHGTN